MQTGAGRVHDHSVCCPRLVEALRYQRRAHIATQKTNIFDAIASRVCLGVGDRVGRELNPGHAPNMLR